MEIIIIFAMTIVAKKGFIPFYLRNFALISKRSLYLAFRKNNRPKFAKLYVNSNPEIKQQVSKIEIEVGLENAIALKVNGNFLPVFRDNTAIKIGFYITPKTKYIKLKVIGVLQYKTIKIPVTYNTPDLQRPIAFRNKLVNKMSLASHSDLRLKLRKNEIRKSEILINTKALNQHNALPNKPTLLQGVNLNLVNINELEQKLKISNNKYHEEQLLRES